MEQMKVWNLFYAVLPTAVSFIAAGRVFFPVNCRVKFGLKTVSLSFPTEKTALVSTGYWLVTDGRRYA